MAENYTVKQGDYLSKIASEHGFFDHTTIWNHPANAELKKKRQNPSVLFPATYSSSPTKRKERSIVPRATTTPSSSSANG